MANALSSFEQHLNELKVIMKNSIDDDGVTSPIFDDSSEEEEDEFNAFDEMIANVIVIIMFY